MNYVRREHDNFIIYNSNNESRVYTNNINRYRGKSETNVWQKPCKEYNEHILFHYEIIWKIKENKMILTNNKQTNWKSQRFHLYSFQYLLSCLLSTLLSSWSFFPHLRMQSINITHLHKVLIWKLIIGEVITHNEQNLVNLTNKPDIRLVEEYWEKKPATNKILSIYIL